MPEDSSSGAHRSKRRSSSRRVSTQRERNDDDEYDYQASNDYRQHRSGSRSNSDTHHHQSSSSGRHRQSHQDDRSVKRNAKNRNFPLVTSEPPQNKMKIAVKSFDDDSTVSSIHDGKPVQKWHQKTWVRIVLGFVIILTTVLITFFVLRATGLGLEKETKKSSVIVSSAPSGLSSEAPSSAPTPVPFFTYGPPDEESCDAKSFETGDTSFVDGENTREFDFTFDVTMSFVDSSGEWVQEFTDKVNEALVPILVGCTDDDENERKLWAEGMSDTTNQLRGQDQQLDILERLQNTSNRWLRRLIDSDEMKFRYVIADATVVGSLPSEIMCPEPVTVDVVSPQQTEICYRVAVYVDLLLRGEERVFSVVRLITTVLTELSNPFGSEPSEDEVVSDTPKPASLLEAMELRSPFTKIAVVGVTNRDPTRSPSVSPSQFPTNRPSVIPTNRPSISPTFFPTHSPSVMPSSNPTEPPSLSPTPLPTTPFPSKPPSEVPTTSQVPTVTSSPSSSSPPSLRPTLMPSCADFWEPQDQDQTAIDPNDPPDTNCESEDENN